MEITAQNKQRLWIGTSIKKKTIKRSLTHFTCKYVAVCVGYSGYLDITANHCIHVLKELRHRLMCMLKNVA